LDGGLPRITIAGFTNGALGVGDAMPQGRATNTYELLDNLSVIGPWGHSQHTLRLGAGARREIANLFLNYFVLVSISFPGWPAFASGHPQLAEAKAERRLFSAGPCYTSCGSHALHKSVPRD